MSEKLKADGDAVTQEGDVRVVYRSLVALARCVPIDVKSLRTFAIEVISLKFIHVASIERKQPLK